MNQEALYCKRWLNTRKERQPKRVSMPFAMFISFLSILNGFRIHCDLCFPWQTNAMYRIRDLFSPGFESGIGGGKNLREGCGGLRRNEESYLYRGSQVKTYTITYIHTYTHTPIHVSYSPMKIDKYHRITITVTIGLSKLL